MRRLSIISILLWSLLLLSCSLVDDPRKPFREESEPTLGVSVEFPAPVMTRAEVGTLPSTDEENALHSLAIWVFTSDPDNHALIAYKPIPESDFPPAGGIRRYSIPVTREFARTPPQIDVFVLANGESIGCNLGADATWEDLNGASFGKTDTEDFFGLTNPVTSIDPEKGLPMSGVGYNKTVQGDAPVLTVETIVLKRAVSRMRFVFCKTKTEGEEQQVVSINNVILSGHQIPLQEYVFTSTSTGIVYDKTNTADSYVNDSFYLPGPSTLAENEAPENYIYVNQDPVAYQRMLDDAVEEGLLTDMGYIYFRESDKRLIGWIEYTVDGVTRTREFSMATAGDFARNHTWTLLGFFLSGRNLQLALNVLPWDMNNYSINFTDQSVMVYSKFTVLESSAVVTQTSKDRFNVKLKPGLAAKGRLQIVSPIGGRLMIKPDGEVRAFTVTPEYATIDPAVNNGYIDITVARNPAETEDLTGSTLTLSFTVEIGERTIDANSEIIDNQYTFIL